MVNLLGWIGLTVLGTLVTLWPTMLRTRMAPSAESASKHALPILLAGLTLVVVGPLLGHALVAVVGIAGYLVGVLWVYRPLVTAARAKTPASFPTLSAGAGLLWLPVGLVLMAPVVAVAAIAIRLDSRGPILFRQTRVGQHASRFQVLKLRSMTTDAEDRLAELRELNEVDGPLFKMAADPRVTRVGKLIRKTSIDEIPQLWNVLRGDMSLVGPRPALPDESEEWDALLTQRLRVKPGITGMWQVNGRSSSSFDDYTRLDLYYVDNWSITTDLAILAKTIPAVVLGQGAH